MVLTSCERRFWKDAEEEARARRARIEAEIDALGPEHAWAGRHYYGDGRGTSVDLTLAPQSGFVFEWNGCTGWYDRNFGSVREVGDRLVLSFEFENVRGENRGLDPEFLTIPWGRRRYLIPPDKLIAFANRINQGDEPRSRIHGYFPLKRGGENEHVQGKLGLPPELAALVLDTPLEAHITRILETRAIEEEGRAWFTSRVALDAGKAQGVFEGMHLFVPEAQRWITIDLLGDHESEAEQSLKGVEPMRIEVGWTCSTAL